MRHEICEYCSQSYSWNWEEAFYKFGFNDGDGNVHTEDVADALREAGYRTQTECWGIHNVIITSIQKNGVELLPLDNEAIQLGYDDPRDYLPLEMITLLDREFQSD